MNNNVFGPETAKLQAFLDAEKAKGLVDFKFTTQPMLNAAILSPFGDGEAYAKTLAAENHKAGITAESLAKELNAMLTAESVPDPEFF